MRTAALAAALVAALATLLAACAPSAEVRLADYLRAVAGGDADRGWSYLSPTTREVGYGNDMDRYLADASAADWAAFAWTDATVTFSDDGFAGAQVTLVSAPDTVPAFLIANRLVHGVCEGDGFQPVGLGAFVDVRPFGDRTLGGGALAGSTVECNSRFIGEAAYPEGSR